MEKLSCEQAPKCLFGINLGLGLAIVHFWSLLLRNAIRFHLVKGNILPDSHRLQKQTTVTLKRLCELILNYFLHVMTTQNVLSFRSNDGHLILECNSYLCYCI